MIIENVCYWHFSVTLTTLQSQLVLLNKTNCFIIAVVFTPSPPHTHWPQFKTAKIRWLLPLNIIQKYFR